MDKINNTVFELRMFESYLNNEISASYFRYKFFLKITNEIAFVEIDEKGYDLNDLVVNKIKNFVIKNLSKLRTLSIKRQDMLNNPRETFIRLNYDNKEYELSSYIKGISKFKYNKIFKQIKNMIIKYLNCDNFGETSINKDKKQNNKKYNVNIKTNLSDNKISSKKYINYIISQHNYQMEILDKLKQRKLFHYSDNKVNDGGVTYFGTCCYDDTVWETFKFIFDDSPEFRTYENYLKLKSVEDLSVSETIQQFLFWKRAERFSDGSIAEAIRDGKFVKLFEKVFLEDAKKIKILIKENKGC